MCIRKELHNSSFSLIIRRTDFDIGWSFGGVVAFEVALQLRKLKHQVVGLILIDSPFPINHKPIPDKVIRYITSSTFRFGVAQKLQEYVITQFRLNSSFLSSYVPQMDGLLDIPVVMLSSRDVLNTDQLCGVPYQWLSDRNTRQDEIKKWNTLIHGQLSVLEIPGNHFEPFEEDNVCIPPLRCPNLQLTRHFKSSRSPRLHLNCYKHARLLMRELFRIRVRVIRVRVVI